jgi:hypothetical protein
MSDESYLNSLSVWRDVPGYSELSREFEVRMKSKDIEKSQAVLEAVRAAEERVLTTAQSIIRRSSLLPNINKHESSCMEDCVMWRNRIGWLLIMQFNCKRDH